MKDYVAEMVDDGYQEYVEHLTKAYLTQPVLDAVLGACAMWRRWTGEIVRPYVSPGSINLSLHMDAKLKDGTHVDKGYHVGLILEHIADHAGMYFKSDEFKRTNDASSDDFKWQGTGNFPWVSVYCYYGGTCQRVQVGTKTIEQPIYEVECT